jgi:hypothetical protein
MMFFSQQLKVNLYCATMIITINTINFSLQASKVTLKEARDIVLLEICGPDLETERKNFHDDVIKYFDSLKKYTNKSPTHVCNWMSIIQNHPCYIFLYRKGLLSDSVAHNIIDYNLPYLVTIRGSFKNKEEQKKLPDLKKVEDREIEAISKKVTENFFSRLKKITQIEKRILTPFMRKRGELQTVFYLLGVDQN